MTENARIRAIAAGTIRSLPAVGADGTIPLERVNLLAEEIGLTVIEESDGSVNLQNALAVLDGDIIFVNKTLPDWYRAFSIAHEIGHHQLHRIKSKCESGDLEAEYLAAKNPLSASEDVLGYGPREKREREANLFAAEILLPASVAIKLFAEEALSSSQIAERTGLPKSFVERQLRTGLFLIDPPMEADDSQQPKKKVSPNESQSAAIETEDLPALISAGPGTGKTETLVRRIIHLLSKGVRAEEILALTFSNKAAEEMRERVAVSYPDDAHRMTIMTFHAFGFEVLRKFYVEANLPVEFGLVDEMDALLAMEDRADELNLKHLFDLRDQAAKFKKVFNSISRAKDELVNPEAFRKLGESMQSTASTDEETKKAEEILEVADIYDFYQKYLEEENLLDFGDLISKSVELLRRNEAVCKSLSNQYAAILVDEFQDVNRASGVLLNLLDPTGGKIWVVGDLRQSIYRWRGASPQNITEFENEYGKANRLSLEVNYRSRPEVVGLFSEFAGSMIAGSGDFRDWVAFRTERENAVRFSAAADEELESALLCRNAKRAFSEIGDWRDQAVICRTHSQLAKFAKALENDDIPVFYIGKLFERPEIRDLLSLVECRTERGIRGMQRVSRFSEYAVSGEAFREVHSALQASDEAYPASFLQLDLPQILNGEDLIGFEKLRAHLELDSEVSDVADFLNGYLFDRSRYLRDIFETDSNSNLIKRAAIQMFLNLCESHRGRESAEAEDPSKRFLRHVRRIAQLDEQRSYSQLPSGIEDFNAVRFLTVHGAKGLEFGTVHLPGLKKGVFPGRKQSEGLVPVGLAGDDSDRHLEEEECLFFVALSRARDNLLLSYPSSSGGRTANMSEFLSRLEFSAPEPVAIDSGEDSSEPPETKKSERKNRQNFYMPEIDKFLKCGLRYYYYHELGIKTRNEHSAYSFYQNSLFSLIEELIRIKAGANVPVTEELAISILNDHWNGSEEDHAKLTSRHKDQAEKLARSAARMIETTRLDEAAPKFDCVLENGAVRLDADSVEISENGGSRSIVLRRYKLGSPPAKETVYDRDALLVAGARAQYGTDDVRLLNVYIESEEEKEVVVSDRVLSNRLKLAEAAIEDINAEKFVAKPSSRDCPNCEFYFICDSGK